MATLAEHPTVQKLEESVRRKVAESVAPPAIHAEELERLAREAGADDVGFVGIDRPEIADQRDRILEAFPWARTLVSYVVRLNRESIRTPARSLANLEFHHAGEDVNEVARRLSAALEKRGTRATSAAAMGFPMEMDQWPRQMWTLSHKPVAVAAGLGKMGIHRVVIHPRFGSFILLGTVVSEAVVERESAPVDFNPCLECRLCVAACPTGAIRSDGTFNFSACYTHNYREFMGGFGDWVENIADSGTRREYRRRVSDAETVSMWQSLGFGPNYKAAYCVAVCPAGDEVIAPFLADRPAFLREIVKPLQQKKETVYVVPGSDAESHVSRRFPEKTTRGVSNGLRPDSVDTFLFGLGLTFQPGAARGVDATYHFTFTGDETRRATVRIEGSRLGVDEGHLGQADFRLTADTRTWLRFLAKEANLVWALARGRIRFRGDPRLLLAFARCFPS